ncbi:MAG: circadian clock protein KaiB [Thiohalocapsa sp.]|jgi:circadian clock protein KaiB|uniref:circadian clock KaiB family protein n=1 Tax=Thiohalocapsa sp. TaxID=2497641 RepID=UPI0025F9831A|nr:circadian clock KaiB family protein [Thiohalocapsa sp.]MCG6940621.1 circadian clock protein KaiB [Thiohalocapsa sp.]
MATASTGLRFLLYVAGAKETPEAAETRLRRLLAQTLTTPHEIEVIDVLEEPYRADEAGVLMTPTLVVRSGGCERRLVGDLSDLSRLRLVLSDPTPDSTT